MFKCLCPLMLVVVANAAMAQAPVFDPQGRVIPHDERRVEAQSEAAAGDAAPVAKPKSATQKHRSTKHKTTTKPAAKKKPKSVRKKKVAPH